MHLGQVCVGSGSAGIGTVPAVGSGAVPADGSVGSGAAPADIVKSEHESENYGEGEEGEEEVEEGDEEESAPDDGDYGSPWRCAAWVHDL